MKRLLILLLVVLGLGTHAVARAQSTPKLSVSVSHSGEDSVGERLAFHIREAIRASNAYELVTGPSALFRISLVTLNPDRESSGNRTAASYVVSMRNTNPFREQHPETWYPIFMTSGVVTSGSARVKETAEELLATLDSEVEEYRSEAQKRDLSSQ